MADYAKLDKLTQAIKPGTPMRSGGRT